MLFVYVGVVHQDERQSAEAAALEALLLLLWKCLFGTCPYDRRTGDLESVLE